MRRRPRLLLVALLPLLTHCATAPRLDGIEPSEALPPASGARLEPLVLGTSVPEDASSSVRLVVQNALAFAFRAATAAQAQRSLDVQYYIWHDDFTGKLLASELLLAAERGVRVRVLVDDLDARAKHDVFAIADLHPRLEVRIFNPFYSRAGVLGKIGEGLRRAARLNRRMHNKAWIADNRVAIVGGRNVGDEYFGAAEQMNFADLDLALAGPVVREVSRSFDEYWNSPFAIPVDRLEWRRPQPAELESLLRAAQEFRSRAGDEPYVAALRDPARRAQLLENAPPALHVGRLELLVDDPRKIGAKSPSFEQSHVLERLDELIRDAGAELLVFSPYFVPGTAGARELVAEDASGTRVAVLTNSLAATDVAAVHSGYARYRRRLLQGGVELYEMKRRIGSEAGRHAISASGSSRSSLHTKAMIVDGRWAFVGSMNLDPRSANLNTEMGVLVESAELAGQLRALFERSIGPALSYRVAWEPGEGLVWYDEAGGRPRRLEREPDASPGRRAGASLLRLVPIDSQL